MGMEGRKEEGRCGGVTGTSCTNRTSKNFTREPRGFIRRVSPLLGARFQGLEDIQARRREGGRAAAAAAAAGEVSGGPPGLDPGAGGAESRPLQVMNSSRSEAY